MLTNSESRNDVDHAPSGIGDDNRRTTADYDPCAVLHYHHGNHADNLNNLNNLDDRPDSDNDHATKDNDYNDCSA